MPSRARHQYNPENWVELIDEKEWTNKEVASACNFEVRHLSNILNGTSRTARTDTKRKIKIGFKLLGANEEEIESLFNSTY